jgi:hypothetical protein
MYAELISNGTRLDVPTLNFINIIRITKSVIGYHYDPV